MELCYCASERQEADPYEGEGEGRSVPVLWDEDDEDGDEVIHSPVQRSGYPY